MEKNTNRTRTIEGELINFNLHRQHGKFHMDEGNTDLTLASAEYDPSPSAEYLYGSWLLLEKETDPPQLALEAQ